MELLDTLIEMATLGALGADLDRELEMLKEWSQTLKEAWDMFGGYKNELIGRHKKEAYETLKSVQVN